MKNFVCTFITLVVFNMSYGQWAYLGTTEAGFGVRSEIAEEIKNEKLKRSILDLSEYRWQNVNISLNGKKDSIIARYNPITDAVEIKENNDIATIAKRNNMRFTFTESNFTYQVKSYYGNDNKIYMSHFLVDEFSDELGIYKKEVFKFSEPKKSKYISLEIKEEELDRSKIYYIIDSSNKLFYLTLDRNTIRKSFPKNAREIIKFIKKHKLRENNKSDLITLARYLQNLQTKKSE